MRLVVVVGIGLSLLGAARRAEAVVCKSRSGAVVLRAACGAREVPVDLAVAGPPGAPGAPGTDGPPGPWTMRVVDAEDRHVGQVVSALGIVSHGPESLPGAPLVYVLVRAAAVGGAALLGVDYAGRPTGALYYGSDDCTGPAMTIGQPLLMPLLEVVGDTVFVPGPPAETVAVGSRETAGGTAGCASVTPRGGCCRKGPATYDGLVVTTAVPLDALGVTPPFRADAP